MNRIYLFLLIAGLSWSCTNNSSDEHTDIDTNLPSSDPSFVEHVVEDRDYTDRLNFIFDEHDVLNKFRDKLHKEDVRGLINTKHEELSDTLIYSKDFGLSEAIDVEYIFNALGKLKMVVVISYHEDAKSQMDFGDEVERTLTDFVSPTERRHWTDETYNCDVRLKMTGNSKNKNVELIIQKL